MAGKDLYVGKRLSFDGALCTVRYHGPLSGTTKGSWLGVEWDDSSDRGKHDGTHQGQQIFSCLSKSSKTAASFVRPTRPSDPPRTFLEALRFKYAAKENAGKLEQPVEISGKTVEEVGFEKIRRQQAELQDLRVAVLDELQLCGIARSHHSSESIIRTQHEISETCPNIVELDLGWSLLERWQDVVDICCALKKLRILKVSGVRLRSFSFDSRDLFTSPFARIQELHLNETLLRPAELAEMLNGHFPRLKILSLAQNELDSMEPSESSQMISLPSIETLILEKNTFKDLSPLASMSSVFPQLKDLSLQQNQINRIGDLNALEMSQLSLFSGLRSLNLSRNRITDFAFVDQLALLFPSLTSLRISNNPLYKAHAADVVGQPSTRSDIPYSFTVARIPSLTVLNHTTITSHDREEGEIYYIAAAGKEITALLKASTDQDRAVTFEYARRKHPRYEVLCRQYDRDSVFDQYTTDTADQFSKPNQMFAAGSLAARLVEATFYVPASSQKPFKRKIARTIDVYRVKALISTVMKLRPLQFRLTYESEELDPIREGFDQKSSDWESWGDWDVDNAILDDAGEEALRENSTSTGTRVKESQATRSPHETLIDGILLRDGKKWKKREVEIIDGTRAWGDYIGDDKITSVIIRVEPFDVI